MQKLFLWETQPNMTKLQNMMPDKTKRSIVHGKE